MTRNDEAALAVLRQLLNAHTADRQLRGTPIEELDMSIPEYADRENALKARVNDSIELLEAWHRGESIILAKLAMEK